MRSEMCLLLEQLGIPVEVHHHEVAGSQNEIGTKFSTLVQRADWTQWSKYIIHNVAHSYGKTATFMPKPVVGDNGSGMRSPVDLEGRPEPVRGQRLCRPVGTGAVLHRRHHQARPCTERDHEPDDELVQASGPALRSTGQARLLGTQPFGIDSHSARVEPEGPPYRNALPGSDGEPVPVVLGADDGRPRRDQNKIHPGEAADKNLYDLPPEEDAKIPTVCAGLDQAIEALDKDREFLTRGGVFTDGMLDAYLALKEQELAKFRMTTHPIEFEMYYSL